MKTTRETSLMQYVIDYLQEEVARRDGERAGDANLVQFLVGQALDAYEGGAR